MPTIKKNGTIIRGEKFTETVVVAADRVQLIDCTVDLGWGENYLYGIQVATRKSGLPYRFTSVIGGEVSGVVGKAIIGNFLNVQGVHIHDIGSDGIFIGAVGYSRVQGCKIERLGQIPGSLPGKDLKGRPMHSDPIQLVGGKWVQIIGNEIVAPHTFWERKDITGKVVATGGRVSNSCVYVESDFTDVDQLQIHGNLFDGGLYSVRIRDEKKGNRVTRARLRNNVFRRYRFGSKLFETEVPVDFDESNDLSGASQLIPAPPGF